MRTYVPTNIFFIGPHDLAIDIGCGTGQATFPFAKHFKKVIGFDPSIGQLEQAKDLGISIEFFCKFSYYCFIISLFKRFKIKKI